MLTLLINRNNDIKGNSRIQKKIEKLLDTEKNNQLDINFDELKKINKDTIGYLEVPNTNIQYVVVKGNDNSYYLNHNFNNEHNVAGWIFMDYRNKADGTDKNMVIYGHDTSDGSMFGSLSTLLDENYLKNNDNKYISFVTDTETKKYQIFSIYTIAPEEYYINTNFSEQEFVEFKETIKERSFFNIDANLDNKNIITLSTCQNHGKRRLAVHAVEI